MNNKGFFQNALISVISILAFFTLALFTSINSTLASVSSYNANDFSQYCSDNPLVCNKINQTGTSGSVSCPLSNQIIANVYVHAGDGQTVYELPHDGFSSTFSNNNATVTVNKTTHEHDLSWIAVICRDNTTTPIPSTFPTTSPVPTVTPSVSATPTINPTSTPTINPTPTATPDCDDDDCCDEDCCDRECSTPSPRVTPTVQPSPTVTSNVTPKPSSTPQPSSSSTPDPNSGKRSALSIVGPNCDNLTFEVNYDLWEDGERRKDIEVTIEYNGNKKTLRTREDGRAQTYFDYNGEGDIKAEDFGDFPGQSVHVSKLDCPSTGTGGAILGTSTGGQVLGTTTDTLGATGVFTDSLIRMITGFIFGMMGYMGMRSTLAKNVFK